MNTALCAPAHCQNCPHLNQSLMGACQLSELSLISLGKVSQVYRKGQTIFQKGTRPNGIYCIHRGKAKLSKVTADGKEQIVRLAKEGDVLGYQSLMANGCYSATAVALSDCVVCHVSRADFLSTLEQNAQFSHALTRLLATTLRETEERIVHMAYKSVRERLADALLVLHQFFQDPTSAASLGISISREDLAAFMGTAKETASRLLSEFREEGLVETHGRRITVLNLAELTKISALYE